MSSINFYRDKPLFLLDIGCSSLKVMQLETIRAKTLKSVWLRQEIPGWFDIQWPDHQLWEALANALQDV